MPRWRLLWVIPLAACGDGGETNGTVTANQIERLATPRVVKADPRASARLQPLTPADLEREGLVGTGCGFSSDGRLLLAAVDSNAIVRIQDEIRHLVHSAPVGPTGGFFEDRHLSVSVGRSSEEGMRRDEATSWRAQISVTNRRTEVQQELPGIWTCGA